MARRNRDGQLYLVDGRLFKDRLPVSARFDSGGNQKINGQLAVLLPLLIFPSAILGHRSGHPGASGRILLILASDTVVDVDVGV